MLARLLGFLSVAHAFVDYSVPGIDLVVLANHTDAAFVDSLYLARGQITRVFVNGSRANLSADWQSVDEFDFSQTNELVWFTRGAPDYSRLRFVSRDTGMLSLGHAQLQSCAWLDRRQLQVRALLTRRVCDDDTWWDMGDEFVVSRRRVQSVDPAALRLAADVAGLWNVAFRCTAPGPCGEVERCLCND